MSHFSPTKLKSNPYTNEHIPTTHNKPHFQNNSIVIIHKTKCINNIPAYECVPNPKPFSTII